MNNCKELYYCILISTHVIASIVDPVIDCCKKAGVPEDCSWFCQDEKLNMVRSNRPVTGSCRKWIQQIAKCWDKEIVSYTSLESCCRKRGVPKGCIGICKGSCEETPWETYNLIPQYQACNEHVKSAQSCCSVKLKIS